MLCNYLEQRELRLENFEEEGNGFDRLRAKFAPHLANQTSAHDTPHFLIFLGLGLVFFMESPRPNHHCLAFGFLGNV